MKLSEHKTALTLGLFVGGMHVIWSLLVALGLAQVLINFSASLHMVTTSPVTVASFNLTSAVLLIFLATAIGYVIGYVFATLWNKVHR